MSLRVQRPQGMSSLEALGLGDGATISQDKAQQVLRCLRHAYMLKSLILETIF
jgi:hypothetical protein